MNIYGDYNRAQVDSSGRLLVEGLTELCSRVLDENNGMYIQDSKTGDKFIISRDVDFKDKQ